MFRAGRSLAQTLSDEGDQNTSQRSERVKCIRNDVACVSALLHDCRSREMVTLPMPNVGACAVTFFCSRRRSDGRFGHCCIVGWSPKRQQSSTQRIVLDQFGQHIPRTMILWHAGASSTNHLTAAERTNRTSIMTPPPLGGKKGLLNYESRALAPHHACDDAAG